MADLSSFSGSYTELIRWCDDSGRTGEIQGGVVVSLEPDQITLCMDDGHTMVGKLFDDMAEPIRLVGTGGDSASSGLLYRVGESLILEYEADVRGRVERTVDTWTVGLEAGAVSRVGLIRQEDLTIWFAGRMQRVKS